MQIAKKAMTFALFALACALLACQPASATVPPGAAYTYPPTITSSTGIVEVVLDLDSMYYTSGHVDYKVSDVVGIAQ
jgi:hypothetical protein